MIGNALSIAGFSAGLLLGLFSLGVLTRRVGQTAALAGAAVGLAVLLAVQFALPVWVQSTWPGSSFGVAWPWFALIGSSTTFLAGLVLSFVFPRSTAGSGSAVAPSQS